MIVHTKLYYTFYFWGRKTLKSTQKDLSVIYQGLKLFREVFTNQFHCELRDLWIKHFLWRLLKHFSHILTPRVDVIVAHNLFLDLNRSKILPPPPLQLKRDWNQTASSVYVNQRIRIRINRKASHSRLNTKWLCQPAFHCLLNCHLSTVHNSHHWCSHTQNLIGMYGTHHWSVIQMQISVGVFVAVSTVSFSSRPGA